MSIEIFSYFITIMRKGDLMNILIDLNDNRLEKVHYDYADYPLYIRKGILSTYPHYAAPSHWHDAIELIAVLSGEMNYNINGKVIPLTKGSGIFVNAKQMHFGFSDTQKECEFICILLHPLLICTSANFENDFIRPITSNAKLPYLYLSSQTPWQKQLLEYISKIYEQKNSPAAVLKAQSLFGLIFALILENVPADSDSKGNRSSDLSLLKNMVSYIQVHYSEKITLQQLAKSENIGQTKCCKLFQTYLNRSPIGYLSDYRLNKSAVLLRNTDLPVTEIAYTVGYGGASYYTESFRKWIGCTPSEYRNRK